MCGLPGGERRVPQIAAAQISSHIGYDAEAGLMSAFHGCGVRVTRNELSARLPKPGMLAYSAGHEVLVLTHGQVGVGVVGPEVIPDWSDAAVKVPLGQKRVV